MMWNIMEIRGLNPREDDHYSENLTPGMLCIFAICRLLIFSSRLTFSKCSLMVQHDGPTNSLDTDLDSNLN